MSSCRTQTQICIYTEVFSYISKHRFHILNGNLNIKNHKKHNILGPLLLHFCHLRYRFVVAVEKKLDKIKVNVCPQAKQEGSGGIASRVLTLGYRRCSTNRPLCSGGGAPVPVELATYGFHSRSGSFGEYKNIGPSGNRTTIRSSDLQPRHYADYNIGLKKLDNFFNKFTFISATPGIATYCQLSVLQRSRFVNTPNHGLEEYCHSRCDTALTCRSLPTFRSQRLPPSYTLNMETACFYETLYFRQNARRHVPADNNPIVTAVLTSNMTLYFGTFGFQSLN